MVAGDRAVRDARTTEKPIRDSRVQRGEIDQISSPLTGSIIHRPQGPEIRHNFGLAQVKVTCAIRYLNRGGGGGIRTRDTVSRIHTFQACAFDRSATPPARASIEKSEGEAHSTGRAARASRGPWELYGRAAAGQALQKTHISPA